MARKFKFVMVEWLDAVSACDWRRLDALPRPVRCVSVGWLVRETKDAVTLAATLSDAEGGAADISEIITIPRGMVKRVRRLRV